MIFVQKDDATLPLILLIDRDLETRRTLLRCLKAIGFEVFGASNGRQGLALIGNQASKDVDGILLDLETLGLEGMAVLQKLQEQHADIPVIVMFSSSNKEQAREVLGKGARDYILKSLDIHLLREKCLQHFKRRQPDAV